MTIEEQLKKLIIEKSGSVNKFSRECGVSQSTIATIFVRGVNNANAKNINRICSYLGISSDELLNGRIVASQSKQVEIDTTKLTERNLSILKAYYQALIDSQEEST